MRSVTIEGYQSEALIAAIEKLERRAFEIKSIIYANPYQEIVQLREDVKNSIQTQGYSASVDAIASAARRERNLMKLVRQQKLHSSDLMLELIEVDMEIDELKRELSRLNFPSLMKA